MGTKVETWMSTTEAAKALGYETTANITLACREGLLRCESQQQGARYRWRVNYDSVADVLLSFDLTGFRQKANRVAKGIPDEPKPEEPISRAMRAEEV